GQGLRPCGAAGCLGVCVPPLAGQLDRERDDGDPEEHHRRARAGAAEGVEDTAMDFGFNQEQELLRNTARKFLENECTSEFLRARMAEPACGTAALWAKL